MQNSFECCESFELSYERPLGVVFGFLMGDSSNIFLGIIGKGWLCRCCHLHLIVVFGNTTTILLIIFMLHTNHIMLSLKLLFLFCLRFYLLPKLFDTWTFYVCVCVCACISPSFNFSLSLSLCHSFCVLVFPNIFWWVSKQSPIVVILLMVLLCKVASSFIRFMWWLTKGDKLLVCHRREKKMENLSPLQKELSFLYKQRRVVVMKV